MESVAKGISIVLLFVLCAATNIKARQSQIQQTPNSPSHTIILRLIDEEGLLIEDEEQVKLFPGGVADPTNVNTHAGCATFEGIAAGNYEAEVEVPGYQMGELEFLVSDSDAGIVHLDFRLAKETREPATLAQNSTSKDQKARKDMKKGFEALKAGNLGESTRDLDAAYKLSPKDPDVNFLMGSLYTALNDLKQAKTYFSRAFSFDPQHVPSLVALGRLLCEQGDVTRATALLQRAVSLDRKQWLAHWLLARIYLGRRDYENTLQEAQQALFWGKRDAVTAEFLIGIALINSGHVNEAASALEQYVRNATTGPATSRAQELVVQLRRDSQPDIEKAVVSAKVVENELPQLLQSPKVEPELPSWIPTSLDDEKPVVSQGSCPLDEILDRASKSVEQFFANVGSFTATEMLIHQRLDSVGQPVSEESRTFDYLAFTRKGGLSFDEYRNGTLDLTQFPAQIATLGLSGLELVFHPKMRDDYQMTCEGLGSWRGKAAWLVYFKQRDDRPRRLQDFQVNGVARSVDVKGRAWISTDNFQVLRLETDMVKPIPELHLLAEREFVEYRPIDFHTAGIQLWLPADAEIYLDFRGKRYRRVHTFSDYKVFSVDTKQVIEPPRELGGH